MFYNSHALIFACYFRSMMSLPREVQAEAKRYRGSILRACTPCSVDKGRGERRLPGLGALPAVPAQDDRIRKALLEDFSLNETRLGLLRAVQKGALFGTVCIEMEVVLQYYKCYCVDFFFLVSNLEVYFLTNCSIRAVGVLDEDHDGLLPLFLFLNKNSLFLCTT